MEEKIILKKIFQWEDDEIETIYHHLKILEKIIGQVNLKYEDVYEMILDNVAETGETLVTPSGLIEGLMLTTMKILIEKTKENIRNPEDRKKLDESLVTTFVCMNYSDLKESYYNLNSLDRTNINKINVNKIIKEITNKIL